MTAVSRVAIVGGGVAGCATAILLAEAGVAVDVFEQKPDLTALGSGITLQGNALRIFEQLGVWEKVRERSYGFDLLGIRIPGPDATIVAEFPDQRTGGPEFPATAGMYRPELARILVDRATELGVRMHFGVGVTSVEADAEGVNVTLSDASSARYDLVIGADGLHSTVRSLIGIDLVPRRTGMGIWRAFVKRPDSVTHTELYYGGPAYIAGYCPTGEDSMYAYLVEDVQDRSGLTPEQGVEVMVGLSQAYHGPWDEIRAELTPQSADRVNYTSFTEHIIDGRWNRGRVVLIGDAAHSCPPTIAQGAAQALEDAAVLAELLIAADTVDDALWDAFEERRSSRAREVVEASTQLGTWLLEHNQDADIPALMNRIATLVSVPA